MNENEQENNSLEEKGMVKIPFYTMEELARRIENDEPVTQRDFEEQNRGEE
ncbi:MULTISPECIES: hypothetical protein [Staphylococcus]|uniref:hypothetical protein n=1 Tax=Staphylococcus TaxID=1279 RepID=UPI0021D3AC8B|nr:hypothetical protein [Staphylococcus arlettae]UXU48953.1 hypothetical protein MUA37_07725 [Staphylococcus arlettae]